MNIQARRATPENMLEKDEYRAKLDAEREESIRRALEADEALNKERELAAREADAARLREQESLIKEKQKKLILTKKQDVKKRRKDIQKKIPTAASLLKIEKMKQR